MAPTPEIVQSGETYFITNVKSGTVIDLSGTDGKSIVGWPYHNGANQKWKLTWTNIGWTFQNVATHLYLGFDGPKANGTKLIAVQQPFGWHIWHDEKNPEDYRIFVPDVAKPGLNIDLYGYGNATPGTPIILWSPWDGIHQTWKFSRA